MLITPITPSTIPHDEPIFPVEIFQIIVDEVAYGGGEDRLRDLKACSLVCRDLSILCRPHIFRDITLVSAGSFQDLQRRQDLRANPFLSRCVHNLRYEVVDNNKPELQQIGAPVNDTDDFSPTDLTNMRSLTIVSTSRKPQISQTPINLICQLLQSCASLESLTTLTITCPSKVSMITIFAIPNLIRLALHGCHCIDWAKPYEFYSEDGLDPVSLFKPKLKAISLISTTNFAWEVFQYTDSLEEITLEETKLCDRLATFPNIFDDSHKCLPLTNLKRLNTDDPEIWIPILRLADSHNRKAFPALTTLTVVFWDDMFPMEINAANSIFNHVQCVETLTCKGQAGIDQLDVYKCITNSNTTLKHLIFDWNSDEYYEDILDIVWQALEAVPGHNVLETITYNQAMYCTYDDNANISFPQWKRLNNILTRNRKQDFPFLKRVSISLKLTCATGVDEWLFTDFLNDPLKDLLAQSGPDFEVDCNINRKIVK